MKPKLSAFAYTCFPLCRTWNGVCFSFLPHRRSRCRARCGPAPRWTYHPPPQGTHSHDTWCWRVRCNLTRETRKSPLNTKNTTWTVCSPDLAPLTSGQRQHGRTFLAVRLPVLHVEEAVPEGFAAGRANKAGGMPRLPQGVHHFLSHTWHNMSDGMRRAHAPVRGGECLKARSNCFVAFEVFATDRCALLDPVSTHCRHTGGKAWRPSVSPPWSWCCSGRRSERRTPRSSSRSRHCSAPPRSWRQPETCGNSDSWTPRGARTGRGPPGRGPWNKKQ